MSIKNIFFDLIFPPKCIFCGEILTKNNLSLKSRRVCDLCEKNILHKSGDSTFETKREFVDFVIAPMSYQDDEVARAMWQYKFQGKKIYADTLADIMAEAVLKNEALKNMLCSCHVVAVPLSKERMRERGYNQSDLLAKKLSQKLEISFEDKWLFKVRHTKRQSSISSAYKRLENIKRAYLAPVSLNGENVLLVDDICTTASTLDECAKTLLGAGAGRVIGICAAINRDFDMDDFKLSVKENTPVW